MDQVAAQVTFNAIVIVPLVGLGWLGRQTGVAPRLLHMYWALVLIKMVMPSFWDTTWTLPNLSATNSIATADAESTPVLDSPQPTNLTEEAVETRTGHSSDAQPQSAEIATNISVEAELPVDRAPRSADTSLFAWLLGCSLLVAALLAWRMVLEHRRLLRWVRRGEPGEAPLQSLLQEVASGLKITRLPQVLLVDGRLSPFVTSSLTTNYLVLPRALLAALSPESTRLMLAHELAHLSRRDLWSRRLSTIVCCLYWWHPLVWWVSQAAREAEDESCDRTVVSTFPGRRRAYAESLLTTVDFLSGDFLSGESLPGDAQALPQNAICGFVRFRGIKRRIQMLSGTETRRASKLWSLMVLASVVLVMPLTVNWTIGNEPPSKEAKRQERRAKRAAEAEKTADLEIGDAGEKAVRSADARLDLAVDRVADAPPTSSNELRRQRRKRRKPNASKIAFVDVAHVFRESKAFKQDMEKLKGEIEQLDLDLRKKRLEIQKFVLERKALDKDSDASKKLEQAAKVSADLLQKTMIASRARFLQSESNIYHNHYTRVYDLISAYAKEEGFKAVFRTPDGKGKSVQRSLDPREIDPGEAQKVLATMNQHVLFVDGDNPEAVDITAAIIAQVNAPAKKVSAPKVLR